MKEERAKFSWKEDGGGRRMGRMGKKRREEEEDGEDRRMEDQGGGGKRMENLSRFHLPFIYHRLLFISFSIYSSVPAASACFGSP